MRLRSGKTIGDAIKLLEGLSADGLNDVSNNIPHVGSASFSKLMTPAILGI